MFNFQFFHPIANMLKIYVTNEIYTFHLKKKEGVENYSTLISFFKSESSPALTSLPSKTSIILFASFATSMS